MSELIYGTRVSLLVGFLAAFLATVVGTAVGLLAGYFRGAAEEVLMRLADGFLLIATLPLVIVLSAYVKLGLTNLIPASPCWGGRVPSGWRVPRCCRSGRCPLS
ncbi:MAG: hypothetical protein H5T97_12855 [Firmicutes bacterium]|nr:hypothetical protein [Bacillota bacterium]